MKTIGTLWLRAVGLTLLLLLLAPGVGLAQTRAAGRPLTPLADLLRPDGTLNLTTGFTGSLDPSGWRMVTDSDTTPHFVRTGNMGTGMTMPGLPGDVNWEVRFGPQGTNGTINALAVKGNRVYFGGLFTSAGGVPANNIAAYNATTGIWSALGSGLNGDVYALVLKGNVLYVGGQFTSAGGISTNYIAAYNTTTKTWSALGSGVSSNVSALAMKGNVLYVAGLFTSAGGISANYIASYHTTTSTWSALGSGVNNSAFAIVAKGNEIFVGGAFTTAGQNPSLYLGSWKAQ
jgi:trimeric autotransporter adhesin